MTSLLSGYQKEWWRFDAVAGVTTAAVAIPKSMAYATIAGLPYKRVYMWPSFPCWCMHCLGSSRSLSVSSTSTIAVLTATQLALVVSAETRRQLLAAACTLTLLVGGVLVVAGLLRLGFLANFILDPVLTGFKAGIALVIVVDQVPKLLGVHVDAGHFFRKILSILEHVPETRGTTLILAAATLAILFRAGAISSSRARSAGGRGLGCRGRRIPRSQSAGIASQGQFR